MAAPSIQITDSGQKRKKILVVDDDAVIVKTLCITLKSKGYQVVTAGDGAEAITQVHKERPDLLIVDVLLAMDPLGCGALGWDGFQVAEWIRGLNCQTPVIIISGTDEPEYRPKTTAVGARGFLTKPINNGLLLATVASLMSGKRPAACAGN